MIPVKFFVRSSLLFVTSVIVTLLAGANAASMGLGEPSALTNTITKNTPNGPFATDVTIPIRWCILNGAPTQTNPGLVGETSIKDVLWRRHERPTDNIYTPQADITFRSAAVAALPTFPVLPDMNISPGSQPGDVLDSDFDGAAEFNAVINQCRAAWSAAAPAITGITAVHIRRFVDNTGTPTGLLGLGGRADFSNAAQQMIAGRAMVIDNAYLFPGSPLQTLGPDPIDKLTGHEFGHALSLPHGDGADNDGDGTLDNEGDTLNGPNLMQYRFFPPDGITMTNAQAVQSRDQAILHIPDALVTTLTGNQVTQGRAMGNTAVDPINEAEMAYADVGEFGAAVDPSTGLTYLLVNFGAPMPEELDNDLLVAFLVDSDGDPQTGGNPEELQIPGVPGAAGVELVGVVNVFKGLTSRVRLYQFTPGAGFNQVVDPDIIAPIVPQQIHHDTFNLSLTDTLVTASHAVHIMIPSKLIDPFKMNFAMQVAVSDLNGVLDQAESDDLTFGIEDFPICTVTPEPLVSGEQGIIQAFDLPPNEDVHALLGPDVVGMGTTDSNGNVSIDFEVPETAEPGSRLVTVGLDDPENAITADCTAVVAGPTNFVYLPVIFAQ